jgi:hypothetical protein
MTCQSEGEKGISHSVPYNLNESGHLSELLCSYYVEQAGQINDTIFTEYVNSEDVKRRLRIIGMPDLSFSKAYIEEKEDSLLLYVARDQNRPISSINIDSCMYWGGVLSRRLYAINTSGSKPMVEGQQDTLVKAVRSAISSFNRKYSFREADGLLVAKPGVYGKTSILVYEGRHGEDTTYTILKHHPETELFEIGNHIETMIKSELTPDQVNTLTMMYPVHYYGKGDLIELDTMR